jgi:hypothetical protein
MDLARQDAKRLARQDEMVIAVRATGRVFAVGKGLE